MKILYIDCWSPHGHLQFNKIHLKALSQIGEVSVIFRKGAFETLDKSSICQMMEIPHEYYMNHEGALSIRLSLARMMLYLWKRVNPNEWDYIILASYDPMALFLSHKFTNAIVIDHNTVADLDNCVKGYCFRHLSKEIKHIVFNEGMGSKLLENGISNYAIVPHGFIRMDDRTWSVDKIKDIKEHYGLGEIDNYLFVPSLSTGYEDLVGPYVYNIDFNKFLKERNLVLLTHSKVERPSMSNIHILQGRLPQEDYEFLFTHSVCNILLYSPTFKYRTSGILNECFANNAPCIMNNNPALLEYNGYINNESCFFSNTKELETSIMSVLRWNSNDAYYRNIDEIADPLKAWMKILTD